MRQAHVLRLVNDDICIRDGTPAHIAHGLDGDDAGLNQLLGRVFIRNPILLALPLFCLMEVFDVVEDGSEERRQLLDFIALQVAQRLIHLGIRACCQNPAIDVIVVCLLQCGGHAQEGLRGSGRAFQNHQRGHLHRGQKRLKCKYLPDVSGLHPIHRPAPGVILERNDTLLFFAPSPQRGCSIRMCAVHQDYELIGSQSVLLRQKSSIHSSCIPPCRPPEYPGICELLHLVMSHVDAASASISTITHDDFCLIVLCWYFHAVGHDTDSRFPGDDGARAASRFVKNGYARLALPDTNNASVIQVYPALQRPSVAMREDIQDTEYFRSVCPGFATPAVGLCPKFLKNTHGNNDFVFIKGIDGIWGIEQNGCV